MKITRRKMLQLTLLGSAVVAFNPKEALAAINPALFKKIDFGPDFLWGTATAAAQIEGAWDVDGKSPSIWDTFSAKKKNIKDNTTNKEACDFYHKYPEDLELMSQMNFDVFRFSVAWSRVLPYGTTHVNQRGIDFYDRLIDTTLEKGMDPWITLYHWDLPQILEDKGGWTNRDVIDWFSEYTALCGSRFGDRVKNWMVFNEPLAFTAVGYLVGQHAPGKKGVKNFLKATHHTAMCQAEGGRILRNLLPDATIGTTFSVSKVTPRSNSKRDLNAAKKLDAFLNRLFVDPLLGKGYPMEDASILKGLKKVMLPGDEEKLEFDFDFFGLQNYFRTVARFSLWPPVMWANQVKAKKLVEDASEITEMGWEVNPKGMYHILKQFGEYGKPLIITENGAAFEDTLNADGTIHDPLRTKFYQDYLQNVLQAKQEGVDVRGYFLWTFMDNFEWAEGYEPRFGIVHNDFETQTRRIKDSGLWWQRFLNESL